MSKIFFTGAIVAALAMLARADNPANPTAKKTTSATYAITGLHCPGCTKTIENSLGKAPGLQSIKVDWNFKDAQVVFDESVTPAERISRLIAATPHMMGPSLHYGSLLVLTVPGMKDEATAKVAKEALMKVAGVKDVEAFPAKHVVEVQFAAEGNATSSQLIDALTGAGIKAQN